MATKLDTVVNMTYAVLNYSTYADAFDNLWYTLGAPENWPTNDRQAIAAWEEVLDDACTIEKIAIAYGNEVEKYIEVLGSDMNKYIKAKGQAKKDRSGFVVLTN